jgi:PAS domain S-box-containing protein
MNYSNMTKKELVEELDKLRTRILRLERKKACPRRSDSVSRLEHIALDTSINAVSFADLEGRVSYVNNAFLDMLGYKEKKDVIGRHTSGFWMSKKEAEKMRTSLFRSGKWVGEMEARKKDGNGITIRLSANLVKDETGQPLCTMACFDDVSGLKKTLEALAESEHKYKMFLEDAAEGILIAEVETKRFIYANPAICRMLSFSRQEILRMGVEDIHPKEAMEHVYADFEAQVRGEKILAAALPCMRKDGSIIYADIKASAARIIDGKQCNIGFFTDVTERKRAEEQLRKAHEQLEARVEQRTEALRRANEDLKREITERKKAEEKLLLYQKKLRSLALQLSLSEEKVRRRTAMDVHDNIGQNLAIIKIKLDSLRKTIPHQHGAQDVDEISSLLAEMIDRARTLTFELSPPVLYELGFEAAVEWLVRQMRERDSLPAEFRDDGRPKPLDEDVRVLLFQSVRESLVNVTKHAKARKVTVTVSRSDDQIHISIVDDGVGFDVSKIRSGGFGLFSISERLNYIRGRFDIESRLGAGTRVFLAAPLRLSPITKKKGGKKI